MKKLPIGIQDLKKLIQSNSIYIDKTKEIFNLINSGSYYFLSRPRRFGKSLLISTLYEIFSNNKNLFKDLWIYKSTYDWQEYPIIKIDFSSMSHVPSVLEKELLLKLENIAQENSIDISQAPSLKTKTTLLIEKLSQKGKVVLLIDEYDFPILENINNLDQAQDCRSILRDFFIVIKSLDRNLKFVFITGITKFSKASIFSGLNNLNDITLKPQAKSLLGYTQEEIQDSFRDYLNKISKNKKIELSELLKNIKAMYNGYRFGKEKESVYNPFSVLLFLENGEFENYWFMTGAPTFLINFIKKNKNFFMKELNNVKAVNEELETFEIENISPKTLLFQSGYLTISDYDASTKNYTLSYPNKEVEISFLKIILAIFTSHHLSEINSTSTNLAFNLINYNLEEFFNILKVFIAGIPYNIKIKKESYLSNNTIHNNQVNRPGY